MASLLGWLKKEVGSVAKGVVGGAVNTAQIPYSAGRIGLANATGNQQAAQNARQALGSDVGGSYVQPLLPFERSAANALLSPVYNHYANQEAQRAQRLLAPTYGANNADIEAGLIRQSFLNQQLGQAGLNPTDSLTTTARKIGGQAGAFTANAALLGSLPKVAVGSLPARVGTFGGINAATGIAQTAQQQAPRLPDYLKSGAQGAAVGAAFPLAAEGIKLGVNTIKGSARLNEVGAIGKDANGKPIIPREGLTDAQLAQRNYVDLLQQQQGAGAQLPSKTGLSAAAKAKLIADAKAKAQTTSLPSNKPPEIGLTPEGVPTKAAGKGSGEYLITDTGKKVTLGQFNKDVPATKGTIPESISAPTGKVSEVQTKPTSVAIGKDLKSGKPEFMDATNRFLGGKQAAQTRNIAAVTQLPKLKGDTSLGAIDAIQQGATTGDFSGVTGAVRKVLDQKYAQLKTAGVDVGYLQDYFPQQWKGATAEQVSDAFQRLNQKAGFQNPRLIPTVREGIDLGFVPKHTDYRVALNEYLNTADRLIANRKYFGQLKSKNLISESPTRPPGMQVIDAPGIPQPRPFVDPETGSAIQGNYYATPSIAKELNKLFSPDIRGVGGNIAKVTGNTSGAMQTLFLSGGVPGTPLNAFGAAQWTKQTLSGHPVSATQNFFRAFSEKATRNYETKNLDYITKMQSAGVPYRGTLDTKALTTVGERIAEQQGTGKAKTAILEAWDKAVEDPTFRRYMPAMQLDVFKGTYNRLIKRGVPEAEAVQTAAEATSNGFGLNMVAKDALKSGVGKDVTRTLFFAPKFRESMVNFWGDNIKSLGSPANPAYRENLKFLANATILFGAMQVANMALNEGKSTFQNENPNDRLNLNIPKGDGKSLSIPFLSSIATLPRVAVNATADVATGKFKESGLEGKKLLSQLVRPPVDLLTNQKYNGREIVNAKDSASKKLKDAALYTAGQYNHPYVSAGINAASGKSSGSLENAVTATELPVRFRNYDNTTPKSKNIQSAKEKDSIKAGTGYSLQQLTNGRYAYTLDGDTTVHEAKNLKDAQKAIGKDAFSNSDSNIKVIGNTVLRKSPDGTVSSMTKDKYDYSLGTAQLTSYKKTNNLNGWLKTANSQLNSIQKQLQDPNVDPLDKLTLQNEAQTIANDMAKYKEYGAFTKGKSGKALASARVTALKGIGSFKTASNSKISQPKGVRVSSPKAPKIVSTRKLSVSKIPSNYLKRKLA